MYNEMLVNKNPMWHPNIQSDDAGIDWNPGDVIGFFLLFCVSADNYTQYKLMEWTFCPTTS